MAFPLSMAALVLDFVTEAEELSGKISSDLLALEAAAGTPGELAKSYKGVARGLHTLKGSAATLGLAEVATLAHGLEDVLAPLQRAQSSFPSVVADAFLKALDSLVDDVRSAAGGGKSPPDLRSVLALVQAAASGEAAAPSLQRAPDELPVASGTSLLPLSPLLSLAAVSLPTPATSPATSAAPPPASSPAGLDLEAEQAAWRVDWSQLKPIADEIEQLRQGRLRLLDIRDRLGRDLRALGISAHDGKHADARAALELATRALTGEAERETEMIHDLESSLKQICTVPAATILDPLRRLVREVCRTTGKEAKLSLVGANLRVDRSVLDAIKAPLGHLLRNAVDHGIETPEVRRKRGKHSTGTVDVRIEQQGNLVFVEVSDDGGGIDHTRIRETAIASGLIPADEALAMDAASLSQLVFRSGFSTRREVTGTSGRGVGLDVVATTVRALGGTVELQSIPEQGSRFILTLPAQMGSALFLRVRCGEQQFGLPLSCIETILPLEIARIPSKRLDMRFEHGGEILSLRDLGALVGLRSMPPLVERQPLLVLAAQGRRLALLVDELLGETEATLQVLPEELRQIPSYLGITVQAQGELLLILKPSWLVGVETTLAATQTTELRALVVDDSLTARALHRTTLESGGYAVHVTASAKQALEQLRHTAYDVVVCDIGMPEMDGIAFTEQVRSDPSIRHVPILLVSALEDGVEKARGLRAGADGFLSKKDCIGGRLLSELAVLLTRKRVA